MKTVGKIGVKLSRPNGKYLIISDSGGRYSEVEIPIDSVPILIPAIAAEAGIPLDAALQARYDALVKAVRVLSGATSDEFPEAAERVDVLLADEPEKEGK